MVLFDVTEEEVLLRLPVKDLLRCKSVCKSWNSLISSPYFIKLHVKHICEKEFKDHKQLGTRRIAMTSRYAQLVGDGIYIPEEWGDYSDLNIEGSSNGLVCMSAFDNLICLTNPSTREFRKLPKPPVLPINGSYPRCYGFGYDSSTDDYKLVFVINQGSYVSLVQILSLKSNLWKLFGHVNYRFHDNEPGILYNGALHWFSSNPEKVVIVSFDLAKEQFTELPQPNDTRYAWNWSNRLGTIKDHLCIFRERKHGRPHRIWVMKNCRVKQSWKLLPTNCQMKDRVHYMIKDSLLSTEMPSYFCCEDTSLSKTGVHIWSPIFVQTLVSPYVNNHGRPSDTNKKKMIDNAGRNKKRRELEEVYTLRDGEKNAFLDKYVLERERTKRQLMLLYKRFKGNKTWMYNFYKRRGHAPRNLMQKEGHGGKKRPRNEGYGGKKKRMRNDNSQE